MPNLVLRDGRRLAYRAYGPADGTPTIFLPGAGCGRLMHFGTDLLVARGTRLICVDRPGLGASTSDPDKTLHTVAADIAELIDAVAGHPVTVIANSQGAPFGLAAARLEQVRALVLVSPIDDLGHPPVAAALSEPHRAFVESVIDDPAGTEQRLRGFTADDLYAMVMTDYPPTDAPVYDDPGFRRLFRNALADGFTSGAAGYARDTVLATCPWPAELFEQLVPVTVLFGRDDAVHSPDLGARLSERLGAQRHVIDGVGGALLWSHPAVVLDAQL